LVYVVLVIQSLLGSGTHIVAKVIVRDVNPITLTFLRAMISGGIFFFFYIASRNRPRFEAPDWKRLMVLGLLAVPLNQFLFLFAIKLTTPQNASLLYGTTPIFVFLLSSLLIGERRTLRKGLGVAMAFIGLLIVVFEEGVDVRSEHTQGNLILLLAVLAWSLYTLWGRPLILKYGAYPVTAMSLMLGALMFLPIGLWQSIEFPFESLTAEHWVELFYLGIGTSIFGYFLWYYALGRIDATKVAIFANAQPVLTALMAVTFLGQPITLNFVVGGVIALAGVVLTQYD